LNNRPCLKQGEHLPSSLSNQPDPEAIEITKMSLECFDKDWMMCCHQILENVIEKMLAYLNPERFWLKLFQNLSICFQQHRTKCQTVAS